MNWDQIGAIGNLVSGAGVVVTLVFLTVQMRQNTLQMRRQTIQLERAEQNAGMAQFSAWRRSIMASPDLARLWAWMLSTANPGELTASELVQARMLLQELMFAVYHVWDRERSGVTTPGDAWNSGMQRFIARLLTTEFGRHYWAEFKETFPPAYRVELERILAEEPGSSAGESGSAEVAAAS